MPNTNMQHNKDEEEGWGYKRYAWACLDRPLVAASGNSGSQSA